MAWEGDAAMSHGKRKSPATTGQSRLHSAAGEATRAADGPAACAEDVELAELLVSLMEGGLCKTEFTWKAELIATADKALKISVGNKEISGTTELLKVVFELSGRC